MRSLRAVLVTILFVIGALLVPGVIAADEPGAGTNSHEVVFSGESGDSRARFSALIWTNDLYAYPGQQITILVAAEPQEGFLDLALGVLGDHNFTFTTPLGVYELPLIPIINLISFDLDFKGTMVTDIAVLGRGEPVIPQVEWEHWGGIPITIDIYPTADAGQQMFVELTFTYTFTFTPEVEANLFGLSAEFDLLKGIEFVDQEAVQVIRIPINIVLPDLAFGTAGITTDVDANGTNRFLVPVTNLGSGIVRDAVLGVTFSDDTDISVPIPELGPDRVVIMAVNVTGDEDDVTFALDPLNVIRERDETNNGETSELVIHSPDLVMREVTRPTKEEIRVYIGNDGDAAAIEVPVSLQYGDEEEIRIIELIRPGETIRLLIPYAGEDPTFVNMSVDPRDRIAELNETNNAFSGDLSYSFSWEIFMNDNWQFILFTILVIIGGILFWIFRKQIARLIEPKDDSGVDDEDL